MIIRWDEMLRCLSQLLARAILIALATPFLILFGAFAYALATSQAQHYVGAQASAFAGVTATGMFGIVSIYGLSYWISSVKRAFGDSKQAERTEQHS